MNRGSPVRIRRSSIRAEAFNEAPIHESGKYETRFTHSLLDSDFNEAPIHESGK